MKTLLIECQDNILSIFSSSQKWSMVIQLILFMYVWWAFKCGLLCEKGFRNHVTIEAKHTIMRNMKIGFSKNIWNFMNVNIFCKCDCIFEQDEHVDQKILIRVQIDFHWVKTMLVYI